MGVGARPRWDEVSDTLITLTGRTVPRLPLGGVENGSMSVFSVRPRPSLTLGTVLGLEFARSNVLHCVAAHLTATSCLPHPTSRPVSLQRVRIPSGATLLNRLDGSARTSLLFDTVKRRTQHMGERMRCDEEEMRNENLVVIRELRTQNARIFTFCQLAASMPGRRRASQGRLGLDLTASGLGHPL